MSQPPPPWSGPPPSYGGPPARRRRKPSGWWFLAPIAMMLAAVALLVFAFVSVLGPLTQEDAVVSADGEPRVVELPDAEPRLLMKFEQPSADPDCEVRDPEGGEPLPLEGPGATYTYGDTTQSWTGFAVVDPLGDAIELTCTGGGDIGVRVVPEPGAGAFAGFAVMLVGGIGLGILGFFGLVVLAILYATGAPRRTT